MPTFKIELPETFGFTRAKQAFTVETSKLPVDIIAQLVMHGAAQKIGDSAAGKDGDDAMKAMIATYETLASGDWGRSRGGDGEEPHMAYVRKIIRAALGEVNKAKYAAIASDDQAARKAFLDELFAGLADEKRATVETEAKRQLEVDRSAKAAARKTGSDLGI